MPATGKGPPMNSMFQHAQAGVAYECRRVQAEPGGWSFLRHFWLLDWPRFGNRFGWELPNLPTFSFSLFHARCPQHGIHEEEIEKLQLSPRRVGLVARRADPGFRPYEPGSEICQAGNIADRR